jgi:hypothetical protein
LTIKEQNVTSLELTIGDQNFDSSELTIREQNVVPLEPKIDESSNQCGLELVMVIICNLND